MPKNERYQDDVMYITQVTRNVLSVLGVWPSLAGERSVGGRISRTLLIIISWILLYCVLIPGLLFWLLEKRTRVKIQTMPLLLYGFMAIGKYGNLIFREKQIKRCLKHIEEDWKNVMNMDVRNAMIESAKTGRRLVILCGAFMYGSGISFRSILPLSKGKIVTPQNITIKPLPCPGYFFSFDAQVSPTYEIIFAMQFFSGLVTFSITTGVCGLTAVFVMHACGQLKILMNLMRNLVEQQWHEKHEVDKKLAQMVEYQIRVRRCVYDSEFLSHHYNDDQLLLLTSYITCGLQFFHLLSRASRTCRSHIIYNLFQLFAFSGMHCATNMFDRINGVHNNRLHYRILYNYGL